MATGKARTLEHNDGIPLNVDWSPEFLFVPRDTSSPFTDVLQKSAGMYHYERARKVESAMLADPVEFGPLVDEALALYRDSTWD